MAAVRRGINKPSSGTSYKLAPAKWVQSNPSGAKMRRAQVTRYKGSFD